MKKYLKFLLMSLFATMTIAFTACGDDDEPNGGNNNKDVVGELTIDGIKTSFYYIFGDNEPAGHKYDYGAMLWRKDGEFLDIQYYDDVYKLAKGDDLSGYLTLFIPFIKDFHSGYNLLSGSIIVADITTEYITLKFDMAVVQNYMGNKTATVDGSIKLPINGEMGSLKNIDGYEWI